MKKALILSNRVRKIPTGMLTIIETLNVLGFKVTWGADFSEAVFSTNELPCETLQLTMRTNPLSRKSINAYKTLAIFLRNNEFDLLECSTPIGGLFGRLLGHRFKIKHIIYQVHGFHFFKGEMWKRWIFKLGEAFLAHRTDTIITINREDFSAASKMHLKNKGNVFYVHGVGISTTHNEVPASLINEMRLSLGIPNNSYVLVSAGELNKNKNTKTIIKAIHEINDKRVFYICCGVGHQINKLKKLTRKYKLDNQILFVGYRNDMPSIYSIASCFVMPSFREGLPRSCMEAMSYKLPCLVSDIRGLVDLIDDEKGGFIFKPSNYRQLANKLNLLLDDYTLCKQMGEYNYQKVQQFNENIVKKEIFDIFSSEVVRLKD